MRYSFISAAVLALVSSVFAQTAGFDAITSPTQDQNIPAGSSFDIVWQPGTVTGTVTITLLQGADPGHLVAGPVIAASIANTLGKFTWSVPSSAPFATYGFEIVLDSTASSPSPTLQYSFPFHITGGSSSSVTGSSATGSSATGTPSTTTVHLSTGPSYTSTATSSIPSSTLTIVSTSSANSTSASATLKPTSSSNITLSTLSKTTSTGTKTSATSSSTSTAPPTQSTNAAVSNIATGGLAMIGGLLLAFAL